MTARSVPPASERAWLEVDTGALARNARRLAARARVPLIAMVKADGYGLGAHWVARALGALRPASDPDPAAQRATGVEPPWALGVATLDEAASLRRVGYTGRLWCGTPLTDRDLADSVALGLTPSLADPSQVLHYKALGGMHWHLNIDTGMQRAGGRWNDTDWLDRLRPALGALPPEAVYTHFHSADRGDGSLDEQERRFAHALALLGSALPPTVLRHSDNSGAIVARAPSPGHLARPGIGLYGGLPGHPLGLESVVAVRARLVDLHTVEPGDSVSYDATWRAERPGRIATLAIGYADGMRRQLGDTAHVALHGRACPIRGRITMDMTMIDVTDVPQARVGDVATVFGVDGPVHLSAADVAHAAGLSPYELLTGLRQRLPHVVLEPADGPAQGQGA